MKLQKVEEKHKQFVTSLGPKVTKHNKSWSEYSAQYKRQQKKQIASDVCTALKFTEKTHFKPSNIEMENTETHETLSIPYTSKHSRGKTFAVFADFSKTRKFYH